MDDKQRIADLERQLKEARETNRRLNRRIQNADSQEGKAVKQLQHLARQMTTLSGRIRDYHQRQRVLVKGSEQEQWRYHWDLVEEHLPRSTEKSFDSLESRIIEAGRRLRGDHPILGWGKAKLLDFLGILFKAERDRHYRLARDCGDKYLLIRRDFDQFDVDSTYFVFRFDAKALHGKAGRKAIRTYLSELESELGELDQQWMRQLEYQLEYWEKQAGDNHDN